MSMSNLDVIRAWKDEEYRLSLGADELALLPDHPAGLIEFLDHRASGLAEPITTEQSVWDSCITICPYTLFATNCIHVCPPMDRQIN